MNAPIKPNRRHLHYVDHTLQKWLLQALIVMEAVLVSLAIWALYQALAGIIDQDMYRIHYSADSQILPLLIKEGSALLGWMLLVNLLALLAADRLWAMLVRDILKKLGRLMLASQNLDFSPQDSIRSNHAVLEQALSWRDAEARRLAQQRCLIRALPDALPASAEARTALAARLGQV